MEAAFFACATNGRCLEAFKSYYFSDKPTLPKTPVNQTKNLKSIVTSLKGKVRSFVRIKKGNTLKKHSRPTEACAEEDTPSFPSLVAPRLRHERRRLSVISTNTTGTVQRRHVSIISTQSTATTSSAATTATIRVVTPDFLIPMRPSSSSTCTGGVRNAKQFTIVVGPGISIPPFETTEVVEPGTTAVALFEGSEQAQDVGKTTSVSFVNQNKEVTFNRSTSENSEFTLDAEDLSSMAFTDKDLQEALAEASRHAAALLDQFEDDDSILESVKPAQEPGSASEASPGASAFEFSDISVDDNMIRDFERINAGNESLAVSVPDENTIAESSRSKGKQLAVDADALSMVSSASSEFLLEPKGEIDWLKLPDLGPSAALSSCERPEASRGHHGNESPSSDDSINIDEHTAAAAAAHLQMELAFASSNEDLGNLLGMDFIVRDEEEDDDHLEEPIYAHPLARDAKRRFADLMEAKPDPTCPE